MFTRNISEIRKNVKSYEQAWAEETRKALQNQLPIWVVLGDSMSQGIGASEFQKGWVGQALNLLHKQKRDYAVINLSRSGARIKDVLLDQLPALEALNIRPSIITVLIGSNDLVSFKYRLKLHGNLEKLLDRLPTGTIVGDIFDRPNTPIPFRSIFAHSSASNLLFEIAHQRDLVVVPLDEAFKMPWRNKLAADFYHPNDQGYKGIAQAFVKAIQERDSYLKM